MSPQISAVVGELREFMFDRVYVPAGDGPEGARARVVVEFLYGYFLRNQQEVPDYYIERAESPERAAVDYIAGMTDQFALHTAEGPEPRHLIGRLLGAVLPLRWLTVRGGRRVSKPAVNRPCPHLPSHGYPVRRIARPQSQSRD